MYRCREPGFPTYWVGLVRCCDRPPRWCCRSLPHAYDLSTTTSGVAAWPPDTWCLVVRGGSSPSTGLLSAVCGALYRRVLPVQAHTVVAHPALITMRSWPGCWVVLCVAKPASWSLGIVAPCSAGAPDRHCSVWPGWRTISGTDFGSPAATHSGRRHAHGHGRVTSPPHPIIAGVHQET